jgi:hypothetical protein
MGLKGSKHISLPNVVDTCSSQEFLLKRKLHDRNEFTLARISRDEYLDTEEDSFNASHNGKRPTFLEPPNVHDDVSKELFRQSSVRSEVNEFTYAKEQLARKKNKSHIDKSVNLEDKKKIRKRKKKSTKRHRSHEPPENTGSSERPVIGNQCN